MGLNNFYFWMPGSKKDLESKVSFGENELDSIIIENINRYILENDFNLERYVKLRNITDNYFSLYVKANKLGEGVKADIYGNRFSYYHPLKERMEEEVFNYLISLGFDEIILKQ